MNNYLSNFNFKNIDNAAINLLTCPDQYISSYTIGMTSLTRTYDSISYNFDKKGNPTCDNKRKNTIAIILESPHTAEFEIINSVLVPKGPLVAKWNDFSNNFDLAIQHSKIKSMLISGVNYELAFVNMVQYQCSLGNSLSGKNSYQKEKKQNVLNCWYNGFNIDLEKRLIAINPSIILVLCGKDFCENVTSMISNNKTLCKITASNGKHPACWKREINTANKNHTQPRLID